MKGLTINFLTIPSTLRFVAATLVLPPSKKLLYKGKKLQPILLKHKGYVQKDICTVIKACPAAAITYQVDEAEPLDGKILFDKVNAQDVGLRPRNIVEKRLKCDEIRAKGPSFIKIFS